MFSNWRSALEQLQDAALGAGVVPSAGNDKNGEHNARSQSLDLKAGADAPASNLRKSLATSRTSSSPGPGSSSTNTTQPASAVRKSNLEERLRKATLASSGDGSAAQKTPPPQARASPRSSPAPANRTPVPSSRRPTVSSSSPVPSRPGTPSNRSSMVKPTTATDQPSDLSLKDDSKPGGSASSGTARRSTPSHSRSNSVSSLSGRTTTTSTSTTTSSSRVASASTKRSMSPAPSRPGSRAGSRTPLTRSPMVKATTSKSNATLEQPSELNLDQDDATKSKPLAHPLAEVTKALESAKLQSEFEPEPAKVAEIPATEDPEEEEDITAPIKESTATESPTLEPDEPEAGPEPAASELVEAATEDITIKDDVVEGPKADSSPASAPPVEQPSSAEPSSDAESAEAIQTSSPTPTSPPVEKSSIDVDETVRVPEEPVPSPESLSSTPAETKEEEEASVEEQPRADEPEPAPEPQPKPTPTVESSLPPVEAVKSGEHSPDETPVPVAPASDPVSPLPSSPPTEKEPPVDVIPLSIHESKLDELQGRLKQVEQRFADVSTSFKRLQAEKMAADAILRDVTPVESIKDAEALRSYFVDVKKKEEVYQDELKRLNKKLEDQEDRLEEIREVHKKEAAFRAEELDKIRTQLDETEALFQAAQRATTEVENAQDASKEDIARLQKEVEASRAVAKEEEEKRVKAVSLLKTVRQKLVKAEKDREDALRDLAALKEKERGDKDKEQADKAGLQAELESLKTSHERTVASLKAQFEKDMAALRERHQQEQSALRSQFESESSTAKESYGKELSAKTTQISNLQTSLNNITREKNSFFDQLQLRQAELESAQEHLGSLQHENTELQFQLRENTDRLALLQEELSELVREQESRARDPAASADEIARAVSASEVKYEARLAELRRNFSVLEKERYESEAEWSKKLKEKVKELEEYKKLLGSTAKTREEETNTITSLKAEVASAEADIQALRKQVGEILPLRSRIAELENLLRDQEEEIRLKNVVFEKQAEDNKVRENQLKAANKTLKDELRKVQSSAALLEKQRNPGIGYWSRPTAEGNGAADSQVSIHSPAPQTPSRTSSPAPLSSSHAKTDDEVNLEYLRNVIFQFLEHKEMRPNLVKVLSTILHFTPQETRRLMSKV